MRYRCDPERAAPSFATSSDCLDSAPQGLLGIDVERTVVVVAAAADAVQEMPAAVGY